METFLYKKNNNKNGLNLLMAYPAIEEFAMSSLGYLWLFKQADTTDGVNVQRLYTDTESYVNLKNIDAISFSLSFDFDFMGMLEILDKYKIPFLAKNRDENAPLIFAGGPVITTNPEPYKGFFDFFNIGDGEESFQKILEILKQKQPKTNTLEMLSKVEGVYVPGISKAVKRVIERLEDVIYTPILSEKSYFKDTFIVEVSRGCMNRCAFCTASYLNLPYRFYPYEKIINTIELGLKYTNKIALLGAQISAHPDFFKILKYLEFKIDNGQKIELGISSLRVDSIKDELIKILVKGGQRTSTIAIEAASERLRRIINKNISEKQILNAVKTARENGLKGLKLYSMLGLPTEGEEDIKEFINLAQKIKQENKGFEIEFSFSTFVPKPNTPFQWTKREDTKSLEKKIKFLEKEFAKIGISAKFSSPKWDYWQTFISRGESDLAEFLIEVYKNGGKLGAYKSAYKNFKNLSRHAIEGCDFEEDLVWDYIITHPNKEFLKKEYKQTMLQN